MSPSNWLRELPSHPIFKPITDASPAHPTGQQRKQRMACRGADLIVAVGQELRITDLVECKEVAGRLIRGGSVAPEQLHYKNLRHPALDFQIQQLCVNPTGKLIAIAGTHLVVVLRLPKARQHKSMNQDLDCEGGLVGANLYHAEGSKIAKIDWHSWGEDGKSLLILTEDAVLREFDVQRDCDEPQQELSFLTDKPPTRPPRPSHKGKSATGSSKRRRAFGTPDEEAETAVSFAVGQGLGDWGPMTLYGLMRNGDIWAVCPFLPQRCSIPSSYVDALNIFLQYKANQLQAELTQSEPPSSKEAHDSTHRETHVRRLAAQRRYADILASQIAAQQVAGSSADHHATGDAYTITLPKLKYLNDGKAVKRQGPFLFKPAPEELVLSAETGPRVEGVASDLVVMPGTGAASSRNSKGKAKEQATALGSGIGVAAIVWKDGRVDVCLEIAKVEAMWLEEVDDHVTPSLAVYESIDLGLLAEIKTAKGQSGSLASRYAMLDNDPPTILVDPFDDATFYVHHALGVHRVSVAPWAHALAAALDADEPEKLETFWQSEIKSENTWAIDAVGKEALSTGRVMTATTIITDLRVGTTLISMTASRHVVALDLTMAAAATVEDPLVTPAKSSESPNKPAYVSLLVQQPYSIRPEDYERLLIDMQIKSLIPAGRGSQPLEMISAEDLRAFGNITQKFAAAIKQVRSLSSQVEGRLDLQVQEVARQLKRVQEATARARAVEGKNDHLVRQMLPTVDTTDNLEYIRQRCKQLVDKQEALTERLGTAMQNMMDRAHPEISLQERAWMDDLEKIKREIEGGEGNDKSLVARIEAVKTELESLTSKDTAAKQADSSQKSAGKGVGISHLAKIENSLRQENVSIESMLSQLRSLSRQLGSMQVEDN
ncbi:hypothetical protein NliqN6_4754 [Naganishia liquefaciens]|uniref:Uncharacterized protein n=1 Tax=Naganishia liquefaciens TaxID=104408 RepID=A0A8H3TWD5_9TREE|nr:hypothetical protein NliqN6_4754 [Naganishia liquefaciens]